MRLQARNALVWRERPREIMCSLYFCPEERRIRAQQSIVCTHERPSRQNDETGAKNNPGSDLLSHTPAHAVPSAVAGLTSVFGMGTGVTLPL